MVAAGSAAAQGSRTAGWPQFQGGPGHEGFRAGGPEPPYRVRWSLTDPSGDRLSPAIVVVGDRAITVGPEAVYGVDLADGTIAWEIPRQGGPLSAPAVGSADGEDVLVYLEGPAPTADGEPSPTSSPTTGPTTPTSPATTGDDDALHERVGGPIESPR